MQFLQEDRESFKLTGTSETQQPTSNQEKVTCFYLWDFEVVKEFSDDVQIRRYTPHKLFQERLMNRLLNSCKGVPGHEECSTYSVWKNKHGVEAAILKNDAHRKSRSMYVPCQKNW